MKKLLLGLLALGSISSFACDKTSQFSFCHGDKIITNKGKEATISGVFKNGNVALKYEGDSTYYNWPTSDLAVTKGCTKDKFCVGDTIITNKGMGAKVSGVFIDGKVTLKYEGNSNNYTWSTSDLAVTKGCTNDNFCVGDTIITNKGLGAKVSGVFHDGNVTLKYEGNSNNYTWSTSDLAVIDACSDRSLIIQ